MKFIEKEVIFPKYDHKDDLIHTMKSFYLKKGERVLEFGLVDKIETSEGFGLDFELHLVVKDNKILRMLYVDEDIISKLIFTHSDKVLVNALKIIIGGSDDDSSKKTGGNVLKIVFICEELF